MMRQVNCFRLGQINIYHLAMKYYWKSCCSLFWKLVVGLYELKFYKGKFSLFSACVCVCVRARFES